jgi:hypothetical protein
MCRVRFEPITLVHALDRVATVVGQSNLLYVFHTFNVLASSWRFLIARNQIQNGLLY